MEYASQIILADRWTGANGADLLTMCQTVTQYTSNVWSIHADDGATLVLREMNPRGTWADWPVQLGQWVVLRPDFGIIARVSDAAYKARWRPLSSIFQEAAGSSGVRAALAIQQEVGAAQIGIILLNGQQTVNVTLTGAFPDATYNVKVRAISGGNVLSMLRVTNMVKTAGTMANPTATPPVAMVPATVAVTVQAVGVASLAGVLLVDALR